jgi:3-oxoadipate enol-lactonase
MPEFSKEDVRFHYEDVGKGAPLVLLHAFPLSSGMWEQQIGALKARYRVLAPDFRGFGGSSVPLGPYRMAQYADDVVALLDHVGIDRAAICGLSMGGYVALAMLRRARGRFAKLILSDTRATPDSEDARKGREDTARDLAQRGMDLLVERTMPKLLSPSPRPEVTARVTALIRANDPRGAAAALRGMAARADSSDLLAGVSVPTLVLVGAADGLTPPAEAKAMADAIPAATMVTLADAGHLSNMEAPEAFNRSVSEFLDRSA